MSQRHGQSQRQRDTHSHRHSHRDTVTAGCLLLYRNLPVSIPNSNYVYARRYFFAFWPPCCIRFQLVWPYLTEKCAALDITIARFHCIQRVPNRNLPVSIPNSNYVYARRYFFAFWPPCCIRFQLVWPYLTEKCAALDITIARFHCIQRVPNKLSP